MTMNESATKDRKAPCTACGKADAEPLGQLPSKLAPAFSANLHRCRACGSIFTSPVNSTDELDRFYSAIFEGGVGKILKESSDAKLKMAQVLLREVSPLLPTHGSALDIGAGLGEWLDLLHSAGLYDAYYGHEYSPAMVRELQSKCPWAQLTSSPAEEIGTVLPDQKFKLISLVAVIEHLFDPQRVLQYIARALEADGKAVIVYPRADSYVSRLMGKHWHLFSPVAHLTLYSERGLFQALSRAGLRPLCSRHLRHYYDLPYVFSFMKYFFPWTVPVVSRLERLGWTQKIGFRAYTGIDVVVCGTSEA